MSGVAFGGRRGVSYSAVCAAGRGDPPGRVPALHKTPFKPNDGFGVKIMRQQFRFPSGIASEEL